MRLIVIELDDDQAAERLVAKFNATTTARVKGMFQVPRARCRCEGPFSENSKSSMWKRSVRGTQFGWWVHDKCHKVSKGLHSEAKNLIPRKDQPQGDAGMITYIDSVSWHDEGHYNDDPTN
jgi:hypothetical protein